MLQKKNQIKNDTVLTFDFLRDINFVSVSEKKKGKKTLFCNCKHCFLKFESKQFPLF